MAVLWGRLFWARDFEIFPDIPNESPVASHVSSSMSMGAKGHSLPIKPSGQPDADFVEKEVEQRDGGAGGFVCSTTECVQVTA